LRADVQGSLDGQIDDSHPKRKVPVTNDDPRAAVDVLLADQPITRVKVITGTQPRHDNTRQWSSTWERRATSTDLFKREKLCKFAARPQHGCDGW
jgi:hypothetical protein